MIGACRQPLVVKCPSTVIFNFPFPVTEIGMKMGNHVSRPAQISETAT